MTWSPNPALSLLCDVGVLCPPRETGMKIKADDAQRCLGTERGIEDAPASRRLPALPGCSGSSPRARRPCCAGVWLGPPARLGGGCSSLLAFLSLSGQASGAYPVTPVETCFREQTPGSGLFWRPTFPQRPIFPRPKNYSGLRASCLWPGHLGGTPQGQNPGLMTSLCPVPGTGPGPRDH